MSALTLAAALLAGPAAAAPGLPSTNVAWLPAAADADIERAFAQARAERKPVLLYWGATWCPPCNQLKATFFNRQDFAALSKSFVAVHVDGDRPGAQKLGRRFKVSGYPTMVLFTPEGAEITRLPGEADAPQVMALLQLGLAGGRPAKAVLADALAGKALPANEWKSLAFYSWATDDEQLLPRAEVASTLVQLAVASPASEAETQTRLWLKALAASDDGQGVKPDAALRTRVQRVLTDPALARVQMDTFSGSDAAAMVRVMEPEGSAGRAPLVAQFDAALRRLEADSTLSRGDRMGALYGRVELARLDAPEEAAQVQLPEPLLKDVRDHVARADREISDGYERQAVITFGAGVLGRAGLWAESDALLKANLAKSHSPYYLMSQLGGNARKQGRHAEALSWYAQAFEKSEGPATRLQWGSGYFSALVDLAPQDAARVEKTASQLLTEAARDEGAFEGRSLRSLQRVGNKLGTWNADGKQAAVLKRLQQQLDGLCPKVDTADGQRAACQALLKPAPKKAEPAA
ncbi:MAG: thioredoxin family protein [Rubrivivax sp.]|nr:thioredoxin family protein [Rubrivivax sp.]